VPGPSPCPDDWHYYNGHCFYTSPDKKEHAAARSTCQDPSMNADLASISDQAEMDFVAGIS